MSLTKDKSLPVSSDRKLFFSKQVDQSTVEELIKKIIEFNEEDDYLYGLYSLHGQEYQAKPIEIYIDSYGGYCYQIMGLLAVMDSSETPIHTIVTGAAMSCGFLLLIHGHERYAYKYATPMYHQISSGLWGPLQDMIESVDETKRLQKMMEKMVLDKTKITKTKLKEIKTAKVDWYMTAEEAGKLGVIDFIIGDRTPDEVIEE